MAMPAERKRTMNRTNKPTTDTKNEHTRRQFIKTSAIGAGSLIAGISLTSKQAQAMRMSLRPNGKKPNFLFIMCDQLSLDAIASHGCEYVKTPHIDRLVNRGVSFMESHSTSPVCSPARSSMLTGLMPVENGVVSNDRPINKNIPTMGNWFRQADYDTVYSGKWHLPYGYSNVIDGFDVMPAGGGQGDLVDTVVSRSCESYLKSRSQANPFVLIASFMQPHDICYWAINPNILVPKELAFEDLKGELPDLPPNNKSWPKSPKALSNARFKAFDDSQWQYYRYIYFRQIEMLDADVGRVLDALDDSGQADNTIVIFTSDHGDGAGHHSLVSKWHPYDESMKVPLVFCCPGKIPQGRKDTTHLVSGLDIMKTMCDYAEIQPPKNPLALSLKPLIEGGDTSWRKFLSADTNFGGRIIRSDRYKYVKYPGDPVEQLFDMKDDPCETVNLYDDPKYTSVMEEHRQLAKQWDSQLNPITPSPVDIPGVTS